PFTEEEALHAFEAALKVEGSHVVLLKPGRDYSPERLLGRKEPAESSLVTELVDFVQAEIGGSAEVWRALQSCEEALLPVCADFISEAIASSFSKPGVAKSFYEIAESLGVRQLYVRL